MPYAVDEDTNGLARLIVEPAIFLGQVVAMPFTYIPSPPGTPRTYDAFRIPASSVVVPPMPNASGESLTGRDDTRKPIPAPIGYVAGSPSSMGLPTPVGVQAPVDPVGIPTPVQSN